MHSKKKKHSPHPKCCNDAVMRLLVSLVNVKPLGLIESFYSRLSNNSVQLTEHLYSKVNVIHVCSGTTGDPSSLPHSFGLDQKAQEWVGGRRAYQNLWLISFHVTRAFTRQSLTAKSETADTTAYCWFFFFLRWHRKYCGPTLNEIVIFFCLFL